MRVLITNYALAKRAGTELYVRDLTRELLRRGHEPIAFSSVIGPVAEEIRSQGVKVVDSLKEVGAPPDVIHCHHWFESTMAAMAFPAVPMLHLCHGALPWLERAPQLGNIAIHGAVDFACRERVASDLGASDERIRVFPNFVDMERFKPRAPLPKSPKTALVFSNYATEDAQIPAIRQTCDQLGIKLTVVGEGVGKQTDSPETVLQNYDLVFAKGRAALEALAVGCAVILCDRIGAGPLVRRSEIEDLRNWNFGFRKLTSPLIPSYLTTQVTAYDASDAGQCHRFVRETCGISDAAGRLLDGYGEAMSFQIPSQSEVIHSAISEWQAVRRAIGENTWVFDPALPRHAQFSEGRWKRKMRSIGRRAADLLREFTPKQR